MILVLRTDKPEAEIYLYSDKKQELSNLAWLADRNLSKDIHKKIKQLMDSQNISYTDLSGIILYRGPGSFTGLRIGASVANALAGELDIPIAGTNGDKWVEQGLVILEEKQHTRIVILEYGSQPKTTRPRK